MASKILECHRRDFSVVVPLADTSSIAPSSPQSSSPDRRLLTESVAIWEPPLAAVDDTSSSAQPPQSGSGTGVSVRHAVFQNYGGSGVASRIQALQGMSAKRPTKPHWYLSLLGTASDSRGRGLASRTIKHVTTECDRLGLPAYLESSDIANVPLYRRHGFEVTSVHQLSDGPDVPLMWREPLPHSRM
jgi:GNAT superfamily N-acetyltransferase